METRNFTAIIAGPDSPSGKVKFGERVSIIEDGGMLRVRCCLSLCAQRHDDGLLCAMQRVSMTARTKPTCCRTRGGCRPDLCRF